MLQPFHVGPKGFDAVSAFVSFCLFCFVSSITPGPNNALLLASGVNFGFRRTVPHMLGVTLGFAFMMLLVGLGLGTLFVAVPILTLLLKVVSTLYLLWLAWQLATATGGSSSEGKAHPMGFFEAALFQWVNPKAWMGALSAVSLYTLLNPLWFNAVVLSVVFGLITGPCTMVWAGLGHGLRPFLNDPARVRLFNGFMALLLVVSLLPLLGEFGKFLVSRF